MYLFSVLFSSYNIDVLSPKRLQYNIAYFDKDFAKHSYNTPYLHNVITIASSSIGITVIDLDLAWFLYNNIFNAILNYKQYKLAFTRHIDIFSI